MAEAVAETVLLEVDIGSKQVQEVNDKRAGFITRVALYYSWDAHRSNGLPLNDFTNRFQARVNVSTKFDYPKQPIRYRIHAAKSIYRYRTSHILEHTRADSHLSAHRRTKRSASATPKGRGDAPSA